MNNSALVIRELAEAMTNAGSKYRQDDVVAIGLRYSDRTVDKVECFYKELVGRVFMITDGQDPVCDAHKEAQLLTIFVCDPTGLTIYDSQGYKPSKAKLILKHDGDRRLLAFKSLTPDEKDKVVDLTLENVWSAIKDIGPSDDLTDFTGPQDSAWGDMPWDNQR